MSLKHAHSNNQLFYELRIANEGPTLPETMQQQLFDSMVSIRQDNNKQPHLGLGIYIVILIIESHNDPINAHNLLNNDGMECVIRIPEKTLANKA